MLQERAIGVGLVGAGGFGEFCLDAFAGMPEARIIAIADVQRARVESLAVRFHAKAYFGIESLLRDPSIEIVALNTPPHLHGSQGLLVLEAGKHLFCEKPLAIEPADARKTIDLAAKKHLSLTVDYVMRHNPFWKAAAELRRSGVFGDLRHMDLANHAAGQSLPPEHWFWDQSMSGGIWIEHGVHFFDAFAWVAGGPGRVISSQQFRRTDGAVDRVEALLQYGGASAHCYHAFDQSRITEQTTVRLTFQNAYITLREWVPTTLELLTPVAPEAWRRLLPGLVEVAPREDGRFFARATATGNKSSVYRQCVQSGMRELIASVRSNGGDDHMSVTGQSALESLQTAADATRLAATAEKTQRPC